MYNSKNTHNDFWADARNKNIQYSKYVLPSAISIHIIAFLSIDMMLNKQDVLTSLAMRFIPVIYILVLFVGLRIKNEFIKGNYTFLLFCAGILSIIPVVHHASYELIENGHLYGGALGIVLLKVLMISFVLLPRFWVLLLYLSLDILIIAGYSYLCGDLFYENATRFVIIMVFIDIALIISYNITLGLRKDHFNASQQLTSAFEQKNKYFNILAHDVKSPVNLMQSAIELIKGDEIAPNRKEYYIDRLGLQLDSLDKLVVNILDWIKASGDLELKKEKLNLSATVSHVLDLNQKLIKDKGIKIVNDRGGDIFVNYDGQSLEIIFNNLLRNAIKFSEKNTSIFISCGKENGEVRFTIKNSGVQIDAQQIEKYKLGKFLDVKNGTTGEKGHGLGLEIIRTLALNNNSGLKIEKEGEYNCFHLIFYDD